MNNTFSNVGHDEEGRQIGNCNTCDANGVIIALHECQTEDEYYNELYFQHELINQHRFMIEHNHLETEFEKTWK